MRHLALERLLLEIAARRLRLSQAFEVFASNLRNACRGVNCVVDLLGLVLCLLLAGLVLFLLFFAKHSFKCAHDVLFVVTIEDECKLGHFAALFTAGEVGLPVDLEGDSVVLVRELELAQFVGANRFLAHLFMLVNFLHGDRLVACFALHKILVQHAHHHWTRTAVALIHALTDFAAGNVGRFQAILAKKASAFGICALHWSVHYVCALLEV